VSLIFRAGISVITNLFRRNTYDKWVDLHIFLEQTIVFNHLIQLTLCNTCILSCGFYLALFPRSPNLMILNINYSQIVELTDRFRSRSMCAIFQKQIKKLTIHDYVDWNEKLMETFSNLKILLFDYKNED